VLSEQRRLQEELNAYKQKEKESQGYRAAWLTAANHANTIPAAKGPETDIHTLSSGHLNTH